MEGPGLKREGPEAGSLIVTDSDPVPPAWAGAVAAIGNFDGAHRGHRALVEATLEAARPAGTPALVLTFEPHPRRVFRPDDPPFLLTTLEEKARLLAELGIDGVAAITFDRALTALSPDAFADKVLRQRLALSHIVIGEDFRFGHDRAGDAATLEALGFAVTVVPPVRDATGHPYSSTRARQDLIEGRPRAAAEILGRPFAVTAMVEEGDRRGRTIGFPTANLRLGPLVAPARGVYAVRSAWAGGEADGVANFGRRPTVNDRGDLLEVHLFDVSPDLYGRSLRVELIEFIRPERRFDGLAALQAQIARDRDQARTILRP